MKALTIIAMAILAISMVTAQPYQDMDSYFNDKYTPDKFTSAARYISAPSSLVGPDGKLYYYAPPVIQQNPKVYYTTISDAEIDGYGEGYNKGYYEGYTDGRHFQRYGIEGYFDYVESFKDKTNPNRRTTGTYIVGGKTVQVTVRRVQNTYDESYNYGVLAGFRDGYYNIIYAGKNRAYYEFEAFKSMFPGTYKPVEPVSHPSLPTYRRFPMRGYYGFNYY